MTRRLFRRRPSAWLVAAAVLAALAAVGSMRAVSREELAPVLVAAVDIPVGARVAEAGLTRIVSVPRSGRLPGMVTDPAGLDGYRAAVPIAAGEPVTRAALGGAGGTSPSPLAVGERAISVPASAAGAAVPVLVPGARVDVVAAAVDGGTAEIVVRAAEVIAVQVQGEEAATGESGAVLLRVGEAEALRLSSALDRGAGVRLLPRPVAEEAP